MFKHLLTMVFAGLVAAPCAAEAFKPALLRNGDLIFQTSQSGQSLAIQMATASPWSHCGLVYIKNGDYYVYEASTKVKSSPLKRFIRKGYKGMFVVKRLKAADSLLTPENQLKLRAAGRKFDGLPYDHRFGWGDDRIYCSELIWKIYRDALGLELGTLRKFKDFELANPVVAAKLKERYPNGVPLDENLIAPADLFADPRLVEVFSNL